LIFERAHGTAFAAVETALRTPDVEKFEREEPGLSEKPRIQIVGPDEDSIASKVVSGVAGLISGQPKPEKQNQAPIQWVMGMLAMLIFERLTNAGRSSWKQRALKKAVGKLKGAL